MVLYGRRRVGKTKRRPLMRKRRMNISRPLNQGKLYKFKRTCEIKPWYYTGADWVQHSTNSITNDVAAPFFAGIFKFRLDDLPNPTDFTSLYEQFRITGVKLRFIPYVGTESSGQTGSYTEIMAMCIDRGANDQVNVSPSFTSLLENQDVKLRNSQRPFSMWIGSPVAHQGADAQTQVVYKASPWLDSELPTRSRIVDHHGLKFSFQAQRPEANSTYYRVYATYYITCRNPQ